MFAAKYPEKYARKYRQTYPELYARLRRNVYVHLNSDLCLDLNNKLFAELNREKFEKSLQQLFLKSFALSFGSLFVWKNRQLRDLSCLVPYRQTLPPRQSVGRPLPGRIVDAAAWPYHLLWLRTGDLTPHPRDKNSYHAHSLTCPCKLCTLRSLLMTRWK